MRRAFLHEVHMPAYVVLCRIVPTCLCKELTSGSCRLRLVFRLDMLAPIMTSMMIAQAIFIDARKLKGKKISKRHSVRTCTLLPERLPVAVVGNDWPVPRITQVSAGLVCQNEWTRGVICETEQEIIMQPRRCDQVAVVVGSHSSSQSWRRCPSLGIRFFHLRPCVCGRHLRDGFVLLPPPTVVIVATRLASEGSSWPCPTKTMLT